MHNYLTTFSNEPLIFIFDFRGTFPAWTLIYLIRNILQIVLVRFLLLIINPTKMFLPVYQKAINQSIFAMQHIKRTIQLTSFTELCPLDLQKSPYKVENKGLPPPPPTRQKTSVNIPGLPSLALRLAPGQAPGIFSLFSLSHSTATRFQG